MKLCNKILNKIEELKDKDNSKFLFQGISLKLLGDIVKKKINPVMLAKQELANVGYDENGKWIGFEQAKKHFKIK